MRWQRSSDRPTRPARTSRRWRPHLVPVYGALVVVVSVVIVTSIPANRRQPLDGSGTVHAVATAPAATKAATQATTATTTTTDPDREMPFLLPTAAEPLRVLEIG